MNRSAATWLRLGEAALFLALLTVGVVGAAYAKASWVAYAIAGALAAVFAFGSHFQRSLPSRTRIAWVIAVLALHAGLIMASRSFLWLAFPLWMVAARVVSPMIGAVATVASLTGVITVLRLDGNTSIPAVLGPIVGALVAFGLARGAMRLEHEANEQRRLLGEVLRAQHEAARLSDDVARAQHEAGIFAERTRLAHDIHDTLAQGFSSIVLLARAAGRASDPGEVHSLVNQIEQTAAQNLAESRRVVYALAPDQDALATSLRRLVDETRVATGAEITLNLDPELPALGSSIEVAMLRSAQSALANVRQHAEASKVVVTVGHGDNMVRLDVVDNGRGFDAVRVPRTPTLEGGYGLRAMRERLNQLGGGLDVESAPGEGTALSAYLPLALGVESKQPRGHV